MIERARANAPPGEPYRFEVAAADALSFPDASFDLGFSIISLHHWPDPLAGLREICPVMRPGGYFVLADFSLGGPLGGAVSRLGRIFHHAVYGPPKILRLFDQADFLVHQQTRPRSLIGRVMTVGRRARARPQSIFPEGLTQTCQRPVIRYLIRDFASAADSFIL